MQQAETLIADFRERGFSFAITADGALRVSPADQMTANDRIRLKVNKPSIVALLRERAEWEHGKTFREARREIVAALDALTDDARQAVFDALNERTAIVEIECGLSYPEALERAEREVLGELLKKLNRKS